jgi:glycosyltransferase involved in cell wall biosynthesis
LSRLGWECAVVAPRYPGSSHAVWNENGQAVGRPAELVSIPSFPLPGYSEIRLAVPTPGPVHRLIQRFRPDLIHCATEFSIGRLGQIAAARARLPLVSSYHTDFARYADAYGKSWLRQVVSGYLKRFHHRSRRVYTPSTISRHDLVRLGVPDVEVWGRGVDASLFHPSRRSREGRAQLGLGDRFTFVYVGRLAAEKQPELIMDAFRIAREILPANTIHLVMAGTGPREKELRDRALPDVTFLGFLDRHTRLPALYANSDAFVFASVTETLGLVLLEAMASGLPVIAAPAGGVRDHLRDGVNGLAYPPGDIRALAEAMVRVATEKDLAPRLGRAARATAEDLSWEREMERLDRSYRQVCEVAVQQAA